jgi:methylation protein EvaC
MELIKQSVCNYNILDFCYICNNKNLNEIFSYNDFALAGGFLDQNDISYEKYYPMTLLYCDNCKLGYIKEIIKKDLLFKTINTNNSYFYYSSKIPFLVRHFHELSNYICNNYPSKKNLLEIGCNDGVLLNQLGNKYALIGIDPSATIKNITNENIVTINDYFCDTIVDSILCKYGKMDIVVSCNCMAHIDKIHEIYENILRILNDDGILIIEVHYFKNIIDQRQFDFIYHEHMLYYNITTFYKIAEKYNLFIEDVIKLDVHGGSIRVTLKKCNNKLLKFCDDKVLKYIQEENNISTDVLNLDSEINIWRVSLLNIINDIKNNNKKLYGYGASGRANTIMEILGVTFDLIFDDSSSKFNKLTPKYHVLIKNSEDIYNTQDIEYIFIFAWAYSSDIIKKHSRFLENGGKFILVLPDIKIIDINNI